MGKNNIVTIDKRLYENVNNNGPDAKSPNFGGKGILVVDHLSAWYGSSIALKNVNMTVQSQSITAIIGPSGCGKSTLIRCLNRMHEISHGGRVEGRILVDNQDIYARGVDPVLVRRRIGMVFQKPTPFPTMSIYDNVAAGIKLSRIWGSGGNLDEIVERSLKQAALWEEVKDQLKKSGASLSGRSAAAFMHCQMSGSGTGNPVTRRALFSVGSYFHSEDRGIDAGPEREVYYRHRDP